MSFVLYDTNIVSHHAHPEQMRMNFFGFRAFMTPRKFLHCAIPLIGPRNVHKKGKIQKILDNIKMYRDMIDRKEPIAMSWLEAIYYKKRGFWRIRGHDGRHKALAIQEIDPLHLMEIHIFPYISDDEYAPFVHEGMIEEMEDVPIYTLESFYQMVISERDKIVSAPCNKFKVKDEMITL